MMAFADSGLPSTLLRRLLAGSRHAFWIADVVQVGAEWRWDLRIPNFQDAQQLLPLAANTEQEYVAAAQASRPPDDVEHVERTIVAALQANQSGYAVDYRSIDRSGRSRWLHDEVQIEVVAAARWRLLGVTTDITDRKRQEQLQAAQSQVLELVAHGSGATDVLQALNALVEDLVPEALCSILAFDSAQSRLVFLAGESLPTAFRKAIDGRVVGPEVGACGAAIYQRRPVLVEDIETSALWKDDVSLVRPFGLRSCWSQPILRADGTVAGTFAIYHKRPALPDALESKILETAAELAGIVLEQRDTRHRLSLSEQRYRAVVETASEGILIVSLDEGVVLEANPAFLRLADLALGAVLNRRYPTLFDLPEETFAADVAAVQAGGTPVRAARLCGTSCREVEVAYRLLGHFENRLLCLIVGDVTERRRADQAVRSILSGARCLFWHADVLRHEDGTWDWGYTVPQMEAAWQFLAVTPSSESDAIAALEAGVAPHDRTARAHNAQGALQAGASGYCQEFSFQDGQGQWRWLREDIQLDFLDEIRVRAVGVITDITAQKRSEEMLDLTLTRSRCLLWYADVVDDNGQLHWEFHLPRPATVRHLLPLDLLASDANEVLWRRRIPRVDRLRLYRRWAEAIEMGLTSFSEEFRCRDRDERLRWLREDVVLESLGPGRWRAFGVCTDITERKDAERILAMTLRSARCLLWEATVEEVEGGLDWALAFPDRDGACRFLGFPTEDGPRLHVLWRATIPEAVREEMDLRAAEAIRYGESGYGQEFPSVGEDGRPRWFREDVVLESLGPGRWRAVGVCTDITQAHAAETERRRALEQLATSREQYQALFLNLRTGVYRSTPDGRILMANPALVRMLGYQSLEELDGVDLESEPLYAEGARQRFREAVERQGELRGWEAVWRRRDGSVIHVLENAQAVRDSEGNVAYYEGTVEDITDRRQAEDQVQWQATHDVLTRLPNRRLFVQRLEAALEAARAGGQMAAVLFVDLDRFKQINDTLGHAVGDELLEMVARRLTRHVRQSDTVARMGGDEFTVLLTGLKGARTAARVAATIQRVIREPFRLAGREFYLGASVGVSLFPRDGDDGTTLLQRADIAMYQAKEQGGNGHRFFTASMGTAALERVTMEGELRRALLRDELVLHFQPQVDAHRRQVVGVEALIRWQHPRLGLLSPAAFLSMAEDTGMIVDLGEWVLRAACRQGARWREDGLDLRIAVNLSARQILRPDFPALLESLLREARLPADRLDLELGETAVFKHAEEARDVLAALKGLGVRLLVDDFGTGYTSLAALCRHQFDALKIDGAFVRGVNGGPEDAGIVRAVIDIARALGMDVVAEGVETDPQRLQLLSMGCVRMQGHYFCAPIVAGAIVDLPQAASLTLSSRALASL